MSANELHYTDVISLSIFVVSRIHEEFGHVNPCSGLVCAIRPNAKKHIRRNGVNQTVSRREYPSTTHRMGVNTTVYDPDRNRRNAADVDTHESLIKLPLHIRASLSSDTKNGTVELITWPPAIFGCTRKPWLSVMTPASKIAKMQIVRIIDATGTKKCFI